MKHQDVLERLRQDPEYVEAEKELRPILDIAADIVRLREEKGWTQQELAQWAGTRQANISRLENGLSNPTLNFLQKVARALDTELTVHVGATPVRENVKLVVEHVVKVMSTETPWGVKHTSFPAPAQWGGFTPSAKNAGELNQYKAA